jgi:hypothetical protein
MRILFLLVITFFLLTAAAAWAVPDVLTESPVEGLITNVEQNLDETQDNPPDDETQGNLPPKEIFNDQLLINGYAQKYEKQPLTVILAMIQDDTLDPIKTAAATLVLRDTYSDELFKRDKVIAEKALWRRLNRTDSVFVQVETMHTLCRLDRYQYFKPLVPALILKMEHYDQVVGEMAARAILDIIDHGKDTAWEARIIFHTQRKVFFLNRNKLTEAAQQNPVFKEKIKILRWTIKILGSEELKALPKELIPLL